MFFYLEAVPLPPETVPFDGPEDFQCEGWPVMKLRDRVRLYSPSEITDEGVVVRGGLRFWSDLRRNDWLYSDSINGPWHKFEKQSTK